MANFSIANGFTYRLMTGAINLQTSTLKALLVKTSYAFDPDQEYVNDIAPSSNEPAGGGYARVALTSQNVTKDNVNNRSVLTFAPIIFPTISVGQIGGLWVFKQVTNDTDSILLWFRAAIRDTNGGNLRFTPPATGGLWVREGA